MRSAQRRRSTEQVDDRTTVTLLPCVAETPPVGEWAATGYVRALERWHEVLVPTLPETDAPECYEPGHLATCVVTQLDADGVADTHVWAYGHSARLAYELALRHPHRVRSLVIGGHGEARAGPESSADHAWWEALATVLRDEGQDASRLLGVPVRRQGGTATAAVIEGLLLAPSADLHRVSVPVLLYAGTLDPALPAARTDASILGAPLAAVTGLGHGRAFSAVCSLLPAALAHLAAVDARLRTSSTV